MIISKMLLVVAIASTMGGGVGAILSPVAARKGNNHEALDGAGRSPSAQRVRRSRNGSGTQHILDQEDAIVDRKISGICRGC